MEELPPELKAMGGKIYVVGIGPGHPSQRTFAAIDAIAKSEVVVGYETYIKLVEDLLGGKEVVSAKMRQEVYRAEVSIAKALEGKTVALVSDGDPQVFGMATTSNRSARDASLSTCLRERRAPSRGMAMTSGPCALAA